MGHFQPTSASAGCSGFWLFSAWPSSPWASLKLKPRQLPIQRLILIFFMAATTARDLLTLSLLLLLMPRLKLTPGMDIMVDMVSDTMVDTTVATTVATLTTATTARDLLMLSLLLPLLLMPRLIPAMATTGASKKSTSIAGLTGMKCQQF